MTSQHTDVRTTARKFVAASSREALRLVREALGADAIVLSHRVLPEGVEIVAMVEGEMQDVVGTAAPVVPVAPAVSAAPAVRVAPAAPAVAAAPVVATAPMVSMAPVAPAVPVAPAMPAMPVAPIARPVPLSPWCRPRTRCIPPPRRLQCKVRRRTPCSTNCTPCAA